MASSRPPKLSSRLPPAGEHPAKQTSAEMDLQVVNIVNGYRQPKLLRVETGSAQELFGEDTAGTSEFLAAALAKMETIERKRKFRRDNTAAATGGAVGHGGGGGVRGGARAEPGVGAGVDKATFFNKLSQPSTPVEEVFQLPKLGVGLFLSLLAEKAVPPSRALWALRAAYPNLTSRDFVKEFFEKAVKIGESKFMEPAQLELAQALMAVAVNENTVAVTDLFEFVFKREVYDVADKTKKLLLCQFVAPFLGLLYNEKPRLVLSHMARLRTDFGAEADSALSIPRLARSADLPLFDSVEQVVAAVGEFLAVGSENGGSLEEQRFFTSCSMEGAVVLGVLHYGVLLMNGQEKDVAARRYACTFVISILHNLKKVPRPVISESLFRFSQQRLCPFAALVWSELIRDSVGLFERFVRLLTLSAVASQDEACRRFGSGLYCPVAERSERELGDAPADAVALELLQVRFSKYLDEGTDVDSVFEGVTEFDLDLYWSNVMNQTQMEFGSLPDSMSVGELSRRMEKQHRLLDVCLLYPRGLEIAECLVKLLSAVESLLGRAFLLSVMSRLWPFGVCAAARSVIQSLIAEPATECIVNSSSAISDDDDCVAVANCGIVRGRPALCTLAVAIRPSMIASYVAALTEFDSLNFIVGSFSSRWSGSSHPHFVQWKKLKMGPVISAKKAASDACSALEEPEHHSLWTLSEAGTNLSVDQAKRVCLAVAERIGKERGFQKIKLWCALLQALKKRPDAATLARVCTCIVPAALSFSSRVLFSRHDHASVVGLVCSPLPAQSFESVLDNVQAPDDLCLAGLERVLPLHLAVLVQCRLVNKEAAKAAAVVDPFVSEGKTRTLAVIREPTNVVRGWLVYSKQAPLTLLSRAMDDHGEAEPEIKRSKTDKHELDASYSFEVYAREHGKTYSSKEAQGRKTLFQAELARVLAHNADSTHTWKRGINRFSDMTKGEKKRFLGANGAALHKEVREHKTQPVRRSSSMPLPRSKDWRDDGVISTVKDQGQCGSCWTFGSTETVESYWALATGDLPVLSQQFILDCTANSDDCGGTGGCQGGTATLAIDTIVRNGGIPQEWTYSYKSYFGAAFQCQNASSPNWSPFAKVSAQIHLPGNVEAPVIETLATTGPLITNVDASDWFSYESGVYSGCSQNATIDHVVQLVGYGPDYLLIRNSWNPSWGEQGYIRLARQTACGWDNNPGQGNVCIGGPSRVQVCGQCGVLYSNSYVQVAV